MRRNTPSFRWRHLLALESQSAVAKTKHTNFSMPDRLNRHNMSHPRYIVLRITCAKHLSMAYQAILVGNKKMSKGKTNTPNHLYQSWK